MGELELGADSKGEGSGPSDRGRRGLDGGSFTADALDALRFVAAGVVAGLVWGAVIGGLGGRMALFLLRLTSDPRVGLAQIHRRDDYAAAERAIGAREGDGPGTIWGRGGPVSVFSCRGETL